MYVRSCVCVGVVGGVVPLAILAVVAFIFIRRRRRQAGGTQLQPQIQEVSEYWKTQPPMSPILSPTSPSLPYNPYYVSSIVSPSGSPAWSEASLLRRLVSPSSLPRTLRIRQRIHLLWVTGTVQ